MPPKKKGNASEPTDSDGEAAAKDDKNIEDIITKAVEKTVAGVKHEFADLLNAKLDHIFKELKAKDEMIVELRNENGELWRHVNSLILRQDAADTYSRVNNLVIHGLPPSYSEAAKSESVDPEAATPAGESAGFETSADSEAIFIGFCGELGIDIQPTDIEACHRLPRSGKVSTHLYSSVSPTDGSVPLFSASGRSFMHPRRTYS